MPTWLVNLLGGGLIDKVLAFIPNPEEKAKAQREMQAALLEAAVKAESDQRDINKVEAASPHWFVAAWRPAVGWLCVVTLAYQWILAPGLTWALNLASLRWGVAIPQLPHLDSQDTQTLLYALLGVGGTMQMAFQSFGDEEQFKKSLRFYLEFMPKADAVPDGKRNAKTFPPEYRKADLMLSMIVVLSMAILIGLPLWLVSYLVGGEPPDWIAAIIVVGGFSALCWLVLFNSGTRLMARLMLYFEGGPFYLRMSRLGFGSIALGTMLQAVIVLLS
jgi:Holin of 3TMs, for gene-transfer release